MFYLQAVRSRVAKRMNTKIILQKIYTKYIHKPINEQKIGGRRLYQKQKQTKNRETGSGKTHGLIGRF